MSLRVVRLFALAFGVGGCWCAHAGLTNYVFARVSGEVSYSGALNNAGEVAYRDNGVFKADIASTTPITSVGGPQLNGRSPEINDQGTVVFLANLAGGGQGLFTGSGGPAATVIDSSGAFQAFGAPVINASAAVAFSASLDVGGTGVFLASGGSVTAVAMNNSQTSPALNDANQVAYFSMSGASQSLWLWSNGASALVADTQGMFSSFDRGPSLNNSGQVAFRGTLDSGEVGVYLSSGGVISTVADSNGAFSNFDNPVVNAFGDVAYAASLDNGDFGIYVDDGGSSDRVIGLGDALDGSIVVSLGIDPGFNDQGQVAFIAFLADGRSGIYLADPGLQVPVPSTIQLVSIALASILLSGGLTLFRRPGSVTRGTARHGWVAFACVAPSGGLARQP